MPRQINRLLWIIHSWSGILAGLGLMLIGLTGSLLVFRDELNRGLFPGRYAVQTGRDMRLDIDELRTKAEAQLPGFEIVGWHLQDPGSRDADELYVIPHGSTEWQTATLDSSTGRLLSTPHAYRRDLMGWLLEFHKSFLVGKTGVAMVALLGLLLLILGLSGIWLHRSFWRRPQKLRLRQGSRVLLSDLHKAVGAVSSPFLLLLGFTGAYWSIEESLAAEFPQERFSERLYPGSLKLSSLIEDAAKQIPGFKTHFVSLPSSPSSPVVILWGNVEPLPFWRDPYSSRIRYDVRTGDCASVSDICRASPWSRVKASFKPLHFGSFGGLPVKCLYAAAGLAPGILALSGLGIRFLRNRALRKRALEMRHEEQREPLQAQA